MQLRALSVATLALMASALSAPADPIDPAQVIAQKFSEASDPKPTSKSELTPDRPGLDYEMDMLSRARAEEQERQSGDGQTMMVRVAAPVATPPAATTPAAAPSPAPSPAPAVPARIAEPLTSEPPAVAKPVPTTTPPVPAPPAATGPSNESSNEANWSAARHGFAGARCGWERQGWSRQARSDYLLRPALLDFEWARGACSAHAAL